MENFRRSATFAADDLFAENEKSFCNAGAADEINLSENKCFRSPRCQLDLTKGFSKEVQHLLHLIGCSLSIFLVLFSNIKD